MYLNVKKWVNSSCVRMATQQNSIYAIYDFVLQAHVNVSFHSFSFLRYKPCDTYTSWMSLKIFQHYVDFVVHMFRSLIHMQTHTYTFNMEFLVLKFSLKIYRGCHWKYHRMKCLENVWAHIHGDTSNPICLEVLAICFFFQINAIFCPFTP